MKWRILWKTMSFHTLWTKKAQNSVVLNDTVHVLPSSRTQTGKNKLSLIFPPLSLPWLDQTVTSHTPPHALQSHWKTKRGNHALQRTPHATLPCAMTRKGRVALYPPPYKYGGREQKKRRYRSEKKKEKAKKERKMREREEKWEKKERQ